METGEDGRLSILFLIYQVLLLLALGPLVLYVRLVRPHELRERMGRAEGGGGGSIWIHAASLGEFEAVRPIVESLAAECGWERILITCMNSVARDRIRDRVPDARVRLAPYDLWPIVHRSLTRENPEALLFAETEIWPAWVLAASGMGIPIVLFSARISDRSYRAYKLLGGGLAPVLSRYLRIGCRTEEDRVRFAKLGAPVERCEVWGNTKYAVGPPPRERESTGGLFVLVAGSMRPGEEAFIDAVAPFLPSKMRLVLAPRHLRTLDSWESRCLRRGLSVRRLRALGLEISEASKEWIAALRTESSRLPDVILVDRMGVLPLLYGAADACLVGGTLVDLGGHSLFEPAREGSAVLFGPSIHGVRDIAGLLLETGGGIQLMDAPSLGPVIENLVSDREETARRGRAARAAADRAAGAVPETIRRLRQLGLYGGAPR